MVDTFQYLEDTLKERIMFLDGAMGTMVQRLKLVEADFRGRHTCFTAKRIEKIINHIIRSRIFEFQKGPQGKQ